jgi:integrase
MIIVISHTGQAVHFKTDVKLLPNQWDESKARVINHPDRLVISTYLGKLRAQIDSIILQLTTEGVINNMTAADIKNFVVSELDPKAKKQKEDKYSFLYRFKQYMERTKPGTRKTFDHTLNRLTAFVGSEEELAKLKFEDINIDWLTRFDTFMARTAPSKNSRNVHYRNMRTVFNEAIEDNITTCYPFRRFKIKNEVTAKRDLSVEELRQLFFYECEESAVKYRDYFKLMFFLMGINNIDLCQLKEIVKGRVEFHRTKTHHFFSMKVEPEALEIIEKYRGKGWLLDILDHWQSDEYFRKKMNKVLQKIGPVTRSGLGGKKFYEPMFPKLTTYYARHTWATIASYLDIPIETISAGLGHEYGNRITAIYINYDNRKVDIANRKVIDWVLYGKIDGVEVVKPGTPEFFGLTPKEAYKLGLCSETVVQQPKRRGRPQKKV